MPISKDEFESGQLLSKLERAIISFLEKNRNRAFTSNEIMDGINIQTNVSNIITIIVSGLAILGFSSVLHRMTVEGKIRMNLIDGQYYYMAK